MFRLLLEVKQGNVGGTHVICRNKLCNRKLTPANVLSYLGLNPFAFYHVGRWFKKKRKGPYLDLITLCRRIGAFQRFIAGRGADGGSGPFRIPSSVKFRRDLLQTEWLTNDSFWEVFDTSFLQLNDSSALSYSFFDNFKKRCGAGRLLSSAVCSYHRSLRFCISTDRVCSPTHPLGALDVQERLNGAITWFKSNSWSENDLSRASGESEWL